MFKDVLWLFVIIVAVVTQWDVIENQQKVPNHLLWYLIRAGVFGLFCLWYYVDEVHLYWAAPAMVFSFGWIFPTLLNKLLDRRLAYLSERGYDKVMKKIFRHEELVFWFLFMMMLISVSMHVVYTYIDPKSWSELF